MTREEIMNMPAGREMDKIIAEKVFGLEIRETEKWVKSCVPSKLRQPDYKVSIISAGGLPLKNYSTDMTAAWDIVKKLPKGEFTLELGARTILATFFGYKNGSAVVRDNEDATPLAICRAALLTTLED